MDRITYTLGVTMKASLHFENSEVWMNIEADNPGVDKILNADPVAALEISMNSLCCALAAVIHQMKSKGIDTQENLLETATAKTRIFAGHNTRGAWFKQTKK